MFETQHRRSPEPVTIELARIQYEEIMREHHDERPWIVSQEGRAALDEKTGSAIKDVITFLIVDNSEPDETVFEEAYFAGPDGAMFFDRMTMGLHVVRHHDGKGVIDNEPLPDAAWIANFEAVVSVIEQVFSYQGQPA